MLSMYLSEQQAQQQAAALEAELEHRQRVHLARASRRACRTRTTGWYDRPLRWLTRCLPVRSSHLDTVHTEERSGIVLEGRR